MADVTVTSGSEEAVGLVDPRAVRVGLGAATPGSGDGRLVVGPLAEPLAPLRDSLAGKGLLGGQAPLPDRDPLPDAPTDETPVLTRGPAARATVLLNGVPLAVRLFSDPADVRAVLVEGEGSAARSAHVVFTGRPVTGPDGIVRREIVVDGWRFDVELEPERRAALRERARRGHEATAHGGPTEVHAIIPGRVVSVSVAPGDALTAGQQILVVEAMKMQNELRAPREGTVQRVGVAPGQTIEVGDLLLVIE
jgi:biotin carboxyl carrier protein